MITILTVAISMIACNTKKDFTKVKEGMTKKEVINILGEPTQKTSGIEDITYWNYKDGEGHIVVFDADTVSNVTNTKKIEKELDEFSKAIDTFSTNAKKAMKELDDDPASN